MSFTEVKAVSSAPVCGDSFSTAVEIQSGEFEGGSMVAGESCYYYINVPNGYEIKVDYEITADYFFGDVTLYDSEEESLSSSDEGKDTLRWLGAEEDSSEQKYFLVMENSYASESSDLVISFVDRTDAESDTDAGGDFDNYMDISYGEHIGYLSNFIYDTVGGDDEYDYYRLQVEKGDSVTIQVTPSEDFFAGCAVYDSKRSELFNNEGLDATEGEIVKEIFEINQDGYLYVVIKWPYYGGFENSIDKYTLLVTNDNDDLLGGEAIVNNEENENSEDESTSGTNKLLILVFSIVLGILLVVLAVVLIVKFTKKDKKDTSKDKSSKPKKEKVVTEVEEKVKQMEQKPKVKVTVEEGTEVEIKKSE